VRGVLDVLVVLVLPGVVDSGVTTAPVVLVLPMPSTRVVEAVVAKKVVSTPLLASSHPARNSGVQIEAPARSTLASLPTRI